MSRIATRGLQPDELERVIAAATRAPSVNNTQPWRFAADGDALELRADLRRGLAVSDPQGRELVISCGAALYNLRLGLSEIHRTGRVTLLPDPHDPRLLARVRVSSGPGPSETERRLLDAIPRRHTHRGAFEEPSITPELAVRLQVAAEAEGTTLLFVHDPGPQRQVLELAREAERVRRSDDRARAEAEDWTPAAGSARRDGVPATSYSRQPPAGPEQLAARDFDLGRGLGTEDAMPQPCGGIAALVTATDLPTDWLRAGQALEAVLLTAAAEWTFAVLHSRVTEVPGLRNELRRALNTAGQPHLLMRFGRAGAAPTTPRRPAKAVIDLTSR
jgi:nitroreductase